GGARETGRGPGTGGITNPTSCSGKLVIVSPDGRHGTVPDWPIFEASYQEGPRNSVLYLTALDPTGSGAGTLRLAILPDAPPGSEVEPIVYTLGTGAILDPYNQGFAVNGDKVAFLDHFGQYHFSTGYTPTVVDLEVVDVTQPTQVSTVGKHLNVLPQIRFSPDGSYLVTANYDFNTLQPRLYAAPTGPCAKPDGCLADLGVNDWSTYSGRFDPSGQYLVGNDAGQLTITALDGSGARRDPSTNLSDFIMASTGYTVFTAPDPSTGHYGVRITPTSNAPSSTATTLLDTQDAGATIYQVTPDRIYARNNASSATSSSTYLSWYATPTSTPFVIPFDSQSQPSTNVGPRMIFRSPVGGESPNYDLWSCDLVAASCVKISSDHYDQFLAYVDDTHLVTFDTVAGGSTGTYMNLTFDGAPPQLLGAATSTDWHWFSSDGSRIVFRGTDDQLHLRPIGGTSTPDTGGVPMPQDAVSGFDASSVSDGSMVLQYQRPDDLYRALRLDLDANGATTSTVLADDLIDPHNLAPGDAQGFSQGFLARRAALVDGTNELLFAPPGAKTATAQGQGVYDMTFSESGGHLLFRNRLRPTGDLYESLYVGMGELRGLALDGSGDVAYLGQSSFLYQFTGEQSFTAARVYSQHPFSWQDGLYGVGPWTNPAAPRAQEGK
ncbi:MAG: hypothetical protein JST92_04065, partial [Deltaproteobacteria bacterium]|nr:hypothetical protein [Deltaproteobacteria bacterium]